MPINLQPVDVMTDLQDAESVLIVPCPICPQFSLAMQNDSPWLEMFNRCAPATSAARHMASRT